MRFTLRELLFAVVAAGATVGMVTNNYWMELEVKRAKIARHEECLSAYCKEIDRLKLEVKNLKPQVVEKNELHRDEYELFEVIDK